ncbi:MAG: tRNA dihydrouridine synthase DusB [Oscillospiraceae bacterium]|nr:tRNA dihydrouridine synthase DusB [Oscillospiraceae bacterium]
MKIGNTELDSRAAALAPMAGVADMAFRELCVGYGAAYVVSEMVSSKGITMSDRKSRQLLVLSERERPAAVQIFGDDPVIMARSAEECLRYRPQAIDINMGCPAPKISGNGGGAALMKNPKKAEEIIRAVVNAVDVPVTVKIRAGWDNDSINAVEIAKRAEQAGVSAITVHGRTKQQMYAPPVNKEIIAAVKRSVSVPVIGNGDIVDGESAAKMIEDTGCDMVMVGRGALGRPWVFSQISAFLKHEAILPEPPVSERMRVMVRHIEKICEYKGERVGIRESRKHAAWYMKGFRGAAGFRREAGTIESLDQLRELAYRVCVENS